MPGTEGDPGFGVKPLDPNLDPTQERYRLGRDYIGAMLKRYKGNQEHALAAYNWGPGNVDKWLKRGANPSELPRETQGYLRNILGEQVTNVSPPIFTGTPYDRSPAANEEKKRRAPPNQDVPRSFDQLLAQLPQLLSGL
jgi:hypothetical protein